MSPNLALIESDGLAKCEQSESNMKRRPNAPWRVGAGPQVELAEAMELRKHEKYDA